MRRQEGQKLTEQTKKKNKNKQPNYNEIRKDVTKTMCLFAAKDSFQAFAHRLQWWIQSSYRTRRNNESRVEKEQSPYLGRPSSGAPDLEGKQEHSQQWTREHGKVVLSQWQKCFVTGICFLWDVCITEGNQRAFFNHWLECCGLRVTELQFKHWVLFYCVFLLCSSWDDRK